MSGRILVSYGPGTTPDIVELAEQEAVRTATKLMLAHHVTGAAVGIEVQHHDEAVRREIYNRLEDARVEMTLTTDEFVRGFTGGVFADLFRRGHRSKGSTEPVRSDNPPRPPQMNRRARRAAKRAGTR